MADEIRKQLELYNQYYKQANELYHNAAQRLGMPDSIFWLLYALCESDTEYTQNDFCVEWGFPKQTVNSAVGNLVRDGYVTMEGVPGTRRKKRLLLTERGMEYARRAILPVLEAERTAFEKMSREERKLYLELSEKHLALLRGELEKGDFDKNAN